MGSNFVHNFGNFPKKRRHCAKRNCIPRRPATIWRAWPTPATAVCSTNNGNHGRVQNIIEIFILLVLIYFILLFLSSNYDNISPYKLTFNSQPLGCPGRKKRKIGITFEGPISLIFVNLFFYVKSCKLSNEQKNKWAL